MSNTSFPLGAQALLSAGFNVTSDTLKAYLVPSTYTFSTSDQFVAALGTTIGTAQTLANKSITGGVFDADDVDFGAIAPGSTIKAVAIAKDTGNTSTSPLLLYFDTVTGLPLATNGGNVTVPWDSGVKKIARLGAPYYPKGAEKVWSGAINMASDTIKAILVPSSYTYDANHDFLDDIASIIGSAVTLTSKSVTNGVFDAADADFGAIASGSTIGSVVLYKDTGTPSTSPLLMRFTDVVGLPLATNGAGILLQWSNGAAKIVSLVPA